MERLVFTHSGKQREGEHAVCISCGVQFIRRAKPQAGRPKSMCCSRVCSGKIQRKRLLVSCSSCGVEFEKLTKDLPNSRSGRYFCGNKCKQKEQRVGGSIAPSHYGTSTIGTDVYWRIAAHHHPVCCVDCGLQFKAFLVVHHADGDNTNQDPHNLEFVCCLHHSIRHMKKTSSGWKYDSSMLTPRTDLALVREDVEAGSLWE
jgi:hypothetical protein